MKVLTQFIRWHDSQVRRLLRFVPRPRKPFSYRGAELRLKELQIMAFVLGTALVAILSAQAMFGGL